MIHSSDDSARWGFLLWDLVYHLHYTFHDEKGIKKIGQKHLSQQKMSNNRYEGKEKGKEGEPKKGK